MGNPSHKSIYDSSAVPLWAPAEPLCLWELLAMQGMLGVAVGGILNAAPRGPHSHRELVVRIVIAIAFFLAPLMIRDARRGSAARFSVAGRISLRSSLLIAALYYTIAFWSNEIGNHRIHEWGGSRRLVDGSCVICAGWIFGLLGWLGGLLNVMQTWESRGTLSWIPLILSIALFFSISSLVPW